MFVSSNTCKCASGYHNRTVSELRFPALFRVMDTCFADTKKKCLHPQRVLIQMQMKSGSRPNAPYHPFLKNYLFSETRYHSKRITCVFYNNSHSKAIVFLYLTVIIDLCYRMWYPQNTCILQKGINSTLDSKNDKNTEVFFVQKFFPIYYLTNVH